MTSAGQRRRGPVGRLLHHQWSAPERAIFIAALTITMGALFVTTYSLALGDPVPHRIKAALVGDARQSPRAADAVARMKKDGLDFAPYQSVASARAAIDEQRVYAALDVKTSARPTLYVASAAGGSVARILERDAAVDPPMLVVDTHPLAPADPNGVDIFYLMLVSSIIGFLTVFQVRANAGGLGLRHWTLWIVGLAVTASLVVTFVDSAILDRFQLPFAETWGILALHILAVASFASTAAVLLGRWAILPTWLFFVVLGNSSSGGAVSPPLLPQPFAFVSQWLPSGATVTSLRDAIYFYNFQHLRPLLVLGTWATVLFAAMIVASRKRQTSPGHG